MAYSIGIIGGGQLGLMTARQAHRLGQSVPFAGGISVASLDPSPDAPAFAQSDSHIVAAYDDLSALERLGDRCDVLTYEFENVPGDILRHLETKYNIPQGIAPLFDSQDRVREKDNARAHGLPVPEYEALPVYADAAADDPAGADKRKSALSQAAGRIGFPCILKTRTLGYDGHGQAVIRSEKDIEAASELLRVPCILEKMIDFDYECSVIMVRSEKQLIHFPVGRNIHKGGILDLCILPAPGLCGPDGEETALCRRIVEACENFMVSCGYSGILAVEIFVKGEDFYFNEMAPRPHNSGHWTIEGCTTNQFSELCKFLTLTPLGEPKLIAPTIMKNILGRDLPAAEEIIRASGKEFKADFCGETAAGVHVHLYGKTEARPLRKMGHVTFVDCDLERYERQWGRIFDGTPGSRV